MSNEMIEICILKVGMPVSYSDGSVVYTEAALKGIAEKNDAYEYRDGALYVKVPSNAALHAIETGSAIDTKKYECGSKCECCGAKDGVFVLRAGDLVKVTLELCGAATACHWDGTGENPNRPITMCQVCSEAYYDHWEEMWAEYWFSQGY